MPKFILCLILTAVSLSAACAPKTVTCTDGNACAQRLQQLEGSWTLTQLAAGRAPQPNEKKTLTFQTDGTLFMDLWEHRLTYTYQVGPTPDQLTLTWIASTNPNDMPAHQTLTQTFSVTADSLTLNGDEFKRATSVSPEHLSIAQNIERRD